ncbi:hypothetical protein JCM19233_6065 [Vibrio astriarenae]|nr:hypothetical protein JCM19233_6065 [Vibrio sp. C7]
MSKFNPFADDVVNAVFEEKEGIVLTASTAELVQILGGEVEAQMAEESGLSKCEWTRNNLKEMLAGNRSLVPRTPQAGNLIDVGFIT